MRTREPLLHDPTWAEIGPHTRPFVHVGALAALQSLR